MTDAIYDPAPVHGPRYEAFTPSDDNQSPASTLDELRAAVAEAEEIAGEEFPDHLLYSPGDVIRLTCSTDLDQAEWKRMQIASMPPAYRKKRIPDPRKVDEVEAFCTLIGEQTIEIAVRQADGSYKPMEGTFADPHLLAAFGTAEPAGAVRKLFADRDAYVLHAGQSLIEACGFGERKPGEPGDPT